MINKFFLSLILGVSMLNSNQTVAQQPPLIPAELTQKALKNPIKVKYTNYRGETAIRTIVPISFYFGSTEYHPEEQWLVKVWDCDRNAERVYALKEITQWFVE